MPYRWLRHLRHVVWAPAPARLANGDGAEKVAREHLAHCSDEVRRAAEVGKAAAREADKFSTMVTNMRRGRPR